MTGHRTVCRQVPVQSFRTVCKDVGHWEEVAVGCSSCGQASSGCSSCGQSSCGGCNSCGSSCGGGCAVASACGGCGGCGGIASACNAVASSCCAPQTQRRWVSQKVQEQVPYTTYKSVQEQVPYTYTVTKCRQEQKQGSRTVLPSGSGAGSLHLHCDQDSSGTEAGISNGFAVRFRSRFLTRTL